MALLQVYQARALMDMIKGSPDRALIGELRTASDLALRGTSVVACVISVAMSTLVVQERHRWLSLVVWWMWARFGSWSPQFKKKEQAVPTLQRKSNSFVPGSQEGKLVVCDLVKSCTPQPPLVRQLAAGCGSRTRSSAFSRIPCHPVESDAPLIFFGYRGDPSFREVVITTVVGIAPVVLFPTNGRPPMEPQTIIHLEHGSLPSATAYRGERSSPHRCTLRHSLSKPAPASRGKCLRKPAVFAAFSLPCLLRYPATSILFY
ncbi:hypothetical protein PO909_010544 [Leuciscus waleckii]